jgi:hypothetical protein
MKALLEAHAGIGGEARRGDHLGREIRARLGA